MFSLNELGQVNGTAGGGGGAAAGGGGGGGLANDEEMPEQHELGEELAFTGRWVTQDASKLIEAWGQYRRSLKSTQLILVMFQPHTAEPVNDVSD